MDTKSLFYIFATFEFISFQFIIIYLIANKLKSPAASVLIISKIILTLVFLNYGLRDVVFWLSNTLVANLLFSFGMFYLLYSLIIARDIFKRMTFLQLSLIPLSTTILLLAIHSTSVNTRAIVGSQIITYFFMAGGLLLIFRGVKFQKVTGYICILVAFLFLARTVIAILVDKSFELHTYNIIQLLSYSSFSLASIFIFIAHLLILKEKKAKPV